jgi:hypothetical protein
VVDSILTDHSTASSKGSVFASVVKMMATMRVLTMAKFSGEPFDEAVLWSVRAMVSPLAHVGKLDLI